MMSWFHGYADEKSPPKQFIPDASRPGVLVIDNNPQVLHILRIAFEKSGFSFFSCEDEATAVTLLRRNRESIQSVVLGEGVADIADPRMVKAYQVRSGLFPCWAIGKTRADAEVTFSTRRRDDYRVPLCRISGVAMIAPTLLRWIAPPVTQLPGRGV